MNLRLRPFFSPSSVRTPTEPSPAAFKLYSELREHHWLAPLPPNFLFFPDPLSSLLQKKAASPAIRREQGAFVTAFHESRTFGSSRAAAGVPYSFSPTFPSLGFSGHKKVSSPRPELANPGCAPDRCSCFSRVLSLHVSFLCGERIFEEIPRCSTSFKEAFFPDRLE